MFLLVLWILGIPLMPAALDRWEVAAALVGLVVVSIIGRHLTGSMLVPVVFAVGVMLSMLGGIASVWLVSSGHGALLAFLVSTVFDLVGLALLIMSIVQMTRAVIHRPR